MICLAALLVFAVMGIFSVRYRLLAKESLDCVLRRVTLRPCESDLNQRLRAKAVATVFKKNKAAAQFLNKHFEIIAWLFIIITLVSAYFAVVGAYNYLVYGNCNGPASDLWCVYNEALGTGTTPEGLGCDLADPSSHPAGAV